MEFLGTIPTPLHESPHSLWYSSTLSQPFNLAPPPPSSHQAHSATQTPQQQQQQAQRSAAHPSRGNHARTFLTYLRADENSITVRKGNIRRFGAGWLKPPGLSKTMQGLWDERAEREEAEAAALREAALQAEQAAAEALEANQDGAGQEGEEGAEQGERDLDDDIPDADADSEGDWIDSDGEEDGLPTNEVDGDFAEDGGTLSMGITGQGMERDLDDDVPDAGSYQHTDTDVEDSSSVLEDDGVLGRSSIGMASVVGFAGLGSSPMPPMSRRERR